jgi:S1-C subfamily serine protease
MSSNSHPSNDHNPLRVLSDAMAGAVERASQSLVTVDARRRFPASGITFSASHILTADHVLERDDDIHVVLPDGVRVDAFLAGHDPGSDLALLRLDQPLLTAARTAQNEPRIGEFVLSLGRPSPEGVQASLGVVSAYGGPIRTGQGGVLERFLRTDAVPYPGFSGGSLINAAGDIVGVNTSGLIRGMSITIPAMYAWGVADMLLNHGQVRRGYLGVRSQPVTLPQVQQQALNRSQPIGLLIVNVEEDSPASRGGLLVGDILVSLAGKQISDPHDLVYQLTGALVGQEVPVDVLRGGQSLSITVIIGERK